ncbi:hypothetical protein BIV57_02280 [Mangrovactinospora gilvigrisea]|uniref:DUF2470 domain-containing protein n=1 Tax=Mangrovactinospora gilvigrisea TaxID=1428644 RepID=A0A1J7CC46_9ACTN|nr:DUF2470 domain-containing protein [Mangrovactinospora gilvigrisea]OIV39076.1 hypothetical protein BIV57_02280 [Mangrovactinospora gilvigrisea]
MDGNRPSAAQRVRTLIEANASAVLDIPGIDPDPLARAARIQGVGPGGELLLEAGLRVTEEVTAVLEITDVAPVAVPHRVRGRAWITGWLTPADEDGVLRLETAGATVDDLWGTGHAEPEELAAASPDPLAAQEAGILQHLAASHAEQLRALDALLPQEERGSGARPVPVALDTSGLRVRYVSDGGRVFDAWFEFDGAVRGPAELRAAMSRLLRTARL